MELDRTQAAARAGGVVCLMGIAVTHLAALPHKVADAPYMAALFAALIYAAVCLAVALVRAGPEHERIVWGAAAGVAATPMVGYAVTRAIPLPDMADHVGHWLSVSGVATLAFEGALLIVAARALRRAPSASSGRGRRPRFTRAAATGCLAVAVAAMVPSLALAHGEGTGSEGPPAAAETADDARPGTAPSADPAPAASPQHDATVAQHGDEAPALPNWALALTIAGAAFLSGLGAASLWRRSTGRRPGPGGPQTQPAGPRAGRTRRLLTPRGALTPLLAALTGATLLVGVAVGSGGRERPHAAGFTEGYGNEKVLAFRYDQQFFCTDDRGDDLDGPGHEGDGIPSERDPDEFQHPAMGPPGAPCIVGETESGSLPKIDPTGDPTRNAEPIWAILPFFDSNRDADPTIEALESPPTPPAVDVQCPEPGPPHTQHTGAFGTCTMHPSTLHAEPSLAELPFPNPAGDIPLPNHSHVIDGDSFNPIWWQTIAVRVTSERIWPDFDGGCPANPRGGEPCVTSLSALREAQSRGEAGVDVPSNVWLFFDSQQVDLDR